MDSRITGAQSSYSQNKLNRNFVIHCMEKKIFNIPLHSVILMVGPTNSGKSHLCKNHLIQDLSKNARPDRPTNIQYISSDDIRRGLGQLHQDDFHKYSNEMLYTSKQTFDILNNRVKAVTSYPINAEYVIVDTKGLSDEFRQEIVDISKRNNYNVGVVVMDYKDRDDYYKNIPEDADEQDIYIYKTFISKDVKRLRTEAMAQLKKSVYNFIHKVTSTTSRSLVLKQITSRISKSVFLIQIHNTTSLVMCMGALMNLKS